MVWSSYYEQLEYNKKDHKSVKTKNFLLYPILWKFDLLDISKSIVLHLIDFVELENFFLWTILGSNCHFGFSSLFKCENDMSIQEVCMRFWNNDLNYIQDVFTHSHRTKCHDFTYKLMRSVQICFSYDFSEYLMSKTQKSHN